MTLIAEADSEQPEAAAVAFNPVTLAFGSDADQKVMVEAGKPLFILGRNGTGKSALVQHFVGTLGSHAVYIPGSRPNYFDQESLSMTPASRKRYAQNSVGWDQSPESRWHAISGTQRNEKAIHDLQVSETQYKVDAANDIGLLGPSSASIALLQLARSPLDRVNSLLKQANLQITLVLKDEIKASRDGEIYSIARMSDGERTAMILAAEVVAAPLQTIFLIDEPELHLHRAIVTPLLAALINTRQDCGFVVSTHELELPRTLSTASLLLVRSITWLNGHAQSWEIDILPCVEDIPESLYIDILGSRRKMLFAEGDGDSLDVPIYALLFPELSVSFREGCRQVIQAVLGVRAVQGMHRVEALGLVDNDAMHNEQIVDLESKDIYPMSVYSVESLYYCEEVLEAVASIQAEIRGGDPKTYLAEAVAGAMKTLENESTVRHLAARLAERFIHDRALVCLPRRKELSKLTQGTIKIEIDSPYPNELAKLNKLVSNQSLHEIIAKYPVRESGILGALATNLKFQNREDYEMAALRRIATSEKLKATLRSKLGKLSQHLAS
jgi:ABC-type cobalamin/Fe3+-siderophores transport system ATPase subunit